MKPNCRNQNEIDSIIGGSRIGLRAVNDMRSNATPVNKVSINQCSGGMKFFIARARRLGNLIGGFTAMRMAARDQWELNRIKALWEALSLSALFLGGSRQNYTQHKKISLQFFIKYFKISNQKGMLFGNCMSTQAR